MSNRRSIIWKIEKDKLEEIVNNSKTITEILANFGLQNKGHNYRTLKKRLKEDDISIEHINAKFSLKITHQKLTIPLEKILVEGSSYNRRNLKTRLLKDFKIKEVCNICDIGPEWNNKKLSLQLDHINGISNDNRLENLRILCPNCHSQTDNFAGKNKIKAIRKTKISDINPLWRHDPRPNRRKVIRPSKKELICLLKTKSMLQLGKDFGVSDKAIAKWKKWYNIIEV